MMTMNNCFNMAKKQVVVQFKSINFVKGIIWISNILASVSKEIWFNDVWFFLLKFFIQNVSGTTSLRYKHTTLLYILQIGKVCNKKQ